MSFLRILKFFKRAVIDAPQKIEETLIAVFEQRHFARAQLAEEYP
jgi:hypothetical protein